MLNLLYIHENDDIILVHDICSLKDDYFRWLYIFTYLQ